MPSRIRPKRISQAGTDGITALEYEIIQCREMTEAKLQMNLITEAVYAGWTAYYLPDRVFK